MFLKLSIILGWGNNFVITLRYFLYQSQIVFEECINGTRKKYANPFPFCNYNSYLFLVNTQNSLFKCL